MKDTQTSDHPRYIQQGKDVVVAKRKGVTGTSGLKDHTGVLETTYQGKGS